MSLVGRKLKHEDGKWTKKGAKSSFGYKLHTKTDMAYGFIRRLETTPLMRMTVR
jgi:IS5 family transposase